MTENNYFFSSLEVSGTPPEWGEEESLATVNTGGERILPSCCVCLPLRRALQECPHFIKRLIAITSSTGFRRQTHLITEYLTFLLKYHLSAHL